LAPPPPPPSQRGREPGPAPKRYFFLRIPPRFFFFFFVETFKQITLRSPRAGLLKHPLLATSLRPFPASPGISFLPLKSNLTHRSNNPPSFTSHPSSSILLGTQWVVVSFANFTREMFYKAQSVGVPLLSGLPFEPCDFRRSLYVKCDASDPTPHYFFWTSLSLLR